MFIEIGVRKYLLCLPLILSLGGCAPASLFYWGEYEDSLYHRYVEQNPAQAEAYLKDSIVKAERLNYRVPPGVYADYGFLLYRRGQKQTAISYFDKEKRLYPESAMLMDKLIERVRLQMTDKIQKSEDATRSEP